jgi:hypothetical protein
MGQDAKWTFMVYMAGDNDLAAAGERDLAEIRSIGSSADVKVVVELDRKGDSGTERLLVRKGGVGEAGIALGETDSGDPEALAAYAAWAIREHPAERYALVLWSHGSGWDRSETDAGEAPGGRGRSRPFFTSSADTLLKSSPRKRAILFDDGSGHSLDTLELGRILERVARSRGHPLDILGMDACLMSNLEVAYQAKEHVRYLVASEGIEPDTGWPYAELLKHLAKGPQQPTAGLVDSIVAAYVQSCRGGSTPIPATLSALNLARIGQLTHALSQLADALTDTLPNAASEIFAAQKASKRFNHDTLWDISDFCLNLEKVSASRATRTAARHVRSALRPGPDRFVVAHDHAGAEFEPCGGVSIYLPPLFTAISKHYSSLDFARQHPWLRMLRAYHEAAPQFLRGAGVDTAPRRRRGGVPRNAGRGGRIGSLQGG